MKNGLENNIWKYYIIPIFAKRMIVPILVVFFLTKNLSATQIGLIFSIGTLAALLFEVPSGYVSDKIGHKKAIALSFLIQSFSMLFYAFGNSFLPFLLGTIVYWAGNSLWTGTGSSFLFETLKDLNKTEEYEKIYGKSIAVSQSAGALLLVLVPFIYAVNPKLAFLFNAALLLFAFFISLTLSQPSFYKHVSREEGFQKLFLDGKRIFAFLASNKKYAAFALFISIWNGIQDAVDEFMQIFFKFLRLPIEFFGIVYGANRVMQGIGAYFTHKLKNYFDQLKTSALIGISLPVFLFITSLMKTAVGAIIFPLRNIVEGFVSPLNQAFLNREIKEGDRITLLSVNNLFAGVFKAIFTFFTGILFDKFSVPATFVILGFGTAIIMLIFYVPVYKAYKIKTLG